MYRFPNSVKELFNVLNFDWPDPTNPEQQADTYPVHCAVVDWSNSLYGKLGKDDFQQGIWPAPAGLVEAIKSVLLDYSGTQIAPTLAYTLVRCGVDVDESVIQSNICPWDNQLFTWKKRNLTSTLLLEKVKAVGLHPEYEPVAIEKLDAWLANPNAHMHNYGVGNVSYSLFNGLCTYAPLHSDGDDLEYADVVKRVIELTNPSLAVTNFAAVALDKSMIDITNSVELEDGADIGNLRVYRQPETFWEVSFDIDNERQKFYVPGSFAWMNDKGLGEELNQLFASINHPQRLFRFGPSRSDDGSFWGHYILAEPTQFKALCAELGIPLAW